VERTEVQLSSLIVDVVQKKPAAVGPWLYNGSRIIDGVFLAQRDGSIISTIADPDSLVNNPRPERDNDDAWQVNSPALPAIDTPMQVTFRLQKSKQP
jgi:hypothetical protein